MRIINETSKKLMLHFATGPTSCKNIELEYPEGSCELDPKEVAGAIYIHEVEDDKRKEKEMPAMQEHQHSAD